LGISINLIRSYTNTKHQTQKPKKKKKKKKKKKERRGKRKGRGGEGEQTSFWEARVRQAISKESSGLMQVAQGWPNHPHLAVQPSPIDYWMGLSWFLPSPGLVLKAPEKETLAVSAGRLHLCPPCSLCISLPYFLINSLYTHVLPWILPCGTKNLEVF
jgi:hypothetical protein